MAKVFPRREGTKQLGSEHGLVINVQAGRGWVGREKGPVPEGNSIISGQTRI